MKSYPCTQKNFLLMELANISFYLRHLVSEPERDILYPARRMASHLPWSKLIVFQSPIFHENENMLTVFFEVELSEEEISSLIV